MPPGWPPPPPKPRANPAGVLALVPGLLLLPLCAAPLAAEPELPEGKAAVAASVDAHAADLTEISDRIWSFAETALQEHRSSEALAEYAEAQGFRVERGVAEMPTAFVASWGSGRPIIGILAEFDALPGISQQATPVKQPLQKDAPGHGCGHNLFGAASLGAAIAVKERMQQAGLPGTLRLYGTPAEETIGGKIYMARAGLFDDLDASLDWHPADHIEADAQSTQALIDFRVRFFGKAAHAAFDPWNGRSAVDGLELYTTGLNYLREHVKPTVRIHYLIERAGDVVNVVPENAVIWTRVRDSKRDGMLEVYERVKRVAAGAAQMAEVEHSVELISGMHEVLVNRAGVAAMQANLELLGPINWSVEEEAFAQAIQEATEKEPVNLDGEVHALLATREDPPGGSTDVGDVSWIVPEVRLGVTTAPRGTPWHSWAVVACGGMSIGHKGLVYAAKALSMTALDILERPELLQEIQAEFRERRGDYEYQAILPEGPPPVPR